MGDSDQGLGFRAWSSEMVGDQSPGFMVYGLGPQVWSLGARVEDFEFRDLGFGVWC